MIGSLGIASSFRLAAAVNVIVGVAAIGCSRGWEAIGRSRWSSRLGTICAGRAIGPPVERNRHLVLAVFAVSGFVSIALEVVWFRVLVLYVESDTYAFTIMLAAVLTGIAVGGYLAAAVLHGWGARLAHLAVIELAVSVSALASFAFLAKSFTVNGRYGEPLAVFGEDVRFVIVAGLLTVLPTAVLLGVAFPIGLALWTAGAAGGSDTGGRVGTSTRSTLRPASLGRSSPGSFSSRSPAAG